MTAVMKQVPRDLPAPTTAANVVRRMLMVAASQIGYREGRSSSGDWNNDNAFGKWYGTNGVSWCAQFVSWAADSATIPASVVPKHQYTPTGWNWFVEHDRDVATPRAGDIFYVYGYVPSEGRSRVHHVGIVEKVLSDGRIQTIEGNTNTTGSAQGNGVYRLIRPVSASKLRFARPDYARAIQIVKPPAKPPTTKPPTKEDDMALNDADKQFITNAAEVAAHRWALWGALYGIETADEVAEAQAEFEKAVDAGATPEQARLQVAAKLSALRADLKTGQAKL